jgi:hypothetical protein
MAPCHIDDDNGGVTKSSNSTAVTVIPRSQSAIIIRQQLWVPKQTYGVATVALKSLERLENTQNYTTNITNQIIYVVHTAQNNCPV